MLITKNKKSPNCCIYIEIELFPMNNTQHLLDNLSHIFKFTDANLVINYHIIFDLASLLNEYS